MDKVNRKRKCGSRKGPQLGLWLWFLAIQCLLHLQVVFAKCQNFDNLSLSVYPEGMIILPYGKPLEIYCMDDKYSADDLEFALGGVTNQSEKVNSTTRRLYKEMHDKGVFSYYCKNKETRKLCTTRVLIDSPPQNVTDFACKSKNLDELNCTWTTPPRYSVTNYSLTFIINGRSVDPCQAIKIGPSRYYCFWSTTSQPRYRQLEKTFHFNLKSKSPFGENEQNFTVDHYSIVQPSRVSRLRVMENGTHSVLLQWEIPNNMVDLMPNGVVHKIEYQIAKIDNTSYFRSVDASNLPVKNKTYKFLLSDLPYAHMQYEVRIYIRSKEATNDEFWSMYSYIVFYTASERPNRPPETITGGFHQSVYEGKRVIYVYWKQLEEYEEAGANFTYKVVTYVDSKNPQTLEPDSKKRSFVILNPASLDCINVKIWSVNDNGSSINSSHLYIPPMKDTESLEGSLFTKLAYENGTYKLSWVGTEGIDNYTLFWCQQNTTQICTGRMNFTTLNPADTEHVIDLPKENRYQFAISANKGAKTSGMRWATCDISKDLIPMYGFPVKLDHGVAGKTSVKITWSMSCTLQKGIISGYLISYCPVINTSNVCDETFENKSSVYIPDPKQMEINITNLKPYRTYQFSLILNTTYGLKAIENASTGVTTTEDTPTEPRNVSISDIQFDSVLISWDPPLHKNGIIWKYVIYNYSKEYYVYKVPENDKDLVRRNVTLSGLHGFQNYSWSIVACIAGIQSCSKHSPSRGITVRTRIGPPSQLRSPEILNTPDMIKWKGPAVPGGTVDKYQILRIKDEQMPGEIFNITNQEMEFSLTHCEGSVNSEKYQVRAVNYDEDLNHGALALTDENEVKLPTRRDTARLEFLGEWSDPTTVACRNKDGLTMTFILMAIGMLAGVMYGSTKFYKKYRKMEDIKPVLPDGLGIPEKDVSKYAFGSWNPSNKDEKPSSDEVLLLPNSRGTTVSTDNKQKDDTNCGSSDHTDSTVLSDTSRGAVDRQASSSDDGSNSSLHLEIGAVKGDGDNAPQDDEDSSNSDSEPSRENSPYFSNKEFKINPASGYVQQPATSPATGYVQSAPAPPPVKSPPVQPASSSYVMAALSPPIFTTGVSPPSLQCNPPPSSVYIRPEDAHLSRSMLNFANPNLSPTKLFGPESLPIMPILPPAAKHGADSSYIQLQSLDALPSQKAAPKPGAGAASGYVTAGDAVISKHLGNMLSAGQLAEESAMIDPMMSPDAYCRFSWSTDPANDNLHSLLADSPTIKPSKN